MRKRLDTARRAVLQLVAAPDGTVANPFNRAVIAIGDHLSVDLEIIRKLTDTIHKEVVKEPNGARMSPEARDALNDLIALCSGSWWRETLARGLIHAAVRDAILAGEIVHRKVYDYTTTAGYALQVPGSN